MTAAFGKRRSSVDSQLPSSDDEDDTQEGALHTPLDADLEASVIVLEQDPE